MPTDTRHLFYTVEPFGTSNIGYTEEGFMILTNVPICRIGSQIYHESETRVPPADGEEFVDIYRDPAEVFRTETINSANGKPFTNNHPPGGDVNVDNWDQLTKGFVLHPRRGEGELSDYMVGDIIVLDKLTQRDIDSGKRQISAGYSADEVVLEPGKGSVRNIIYNHVALVDEARCGVGCTIQDKKYKEPEMKESKWKKFLDGLRGVIADAESEEEKEKEKKEDGESEKEKEKKEDAEPEKEKEKKEDSATKTRLDALEEKFDTLSNKLDSITDAIAKKRDEKSEEEKEKEKEKKEDAKGDDEEDDEEEDKKKKDSAYLEPTYQEVVALAEIISPGIRVFSFDAAANSTTTAKNICDLRKKALRFGMLDARTYGFVEAVRNGRELTEATLVKLDCKSTRTLFEAVGNMKKADNDQSFLKSKSNGRTATTPGKVQTIDDINKRNAEFYATRKY